MVRFCQSMAAEPPYRFRRRHSNSYQAYLVPSGTSYLERLDKLGSRERHIGWGVEEELNSLWYAAALDEHHGE